MTINSGDSESNIPVDSGESLTTSDCIQITQINNNQNMLRIQSLNEDETEELIRL